MFRLPQQLTQKRRKAIILLVVIAMLTLFAILGLAFVLYADAEATASRLGREAQTLSVDKPDETGEYLLNYFLGRFIYPVPDDATGVTSALRGHELARLMYGWWDPTDTVNAPPMNPNTNPFNGTGRLHGNGINMNPFGVDEYSLINYMFFSGDKVYPLTAPAANRGPYVRDPERLIPNTTQPLRTDPSNLAARGQYTGGFNVPWTYPDLSNMFLAAVRADGTVLMPSFYRPYTGFNTFNGVTYYGFDPTNPNWTAGSAAAPVGDQVKYQILRPRPADMDPNYFPYPDDGGGDVKNLVGSPGTLNPVQDPAKPNIPRYWSNDSFWMDLGFPVKTAPDGRRYKALFAPLIIDLDNRINLNVHGSTKGRSTTTGNPIQHLSNQGLGKWEVNLSWVLSRDLNAPGGTTTGATPPVPEWAQLMRGLGTTPGSLNPPGRYGQDQRPDNPTTASNVASGPGTMPHFYGQVDYDGCNDATGPNYTTTTAFKLGSNRVTPTSPAITSGGRVPCFPEFVNYDTLTALPVTPPAAYWGYGSGSSGAAGPAGPDTPVPAPDELTDHPSAYAYFNPGGATTPTNTLDRVFDVASMQSMLYTGATTSPGTDIGKLCPLNFGDKTDVAGSQRRRNMVTTLSMDMERPGITPWWSDSTQWGASNTYNFVTPATYPALNIFPKWTNSATANGPLGFPSTLPRYAPPAPAAGLSEFGSDWRATSRAYEESAASSTVLANALARVDLNRKLTDYPAPGATGVIDLVTTASAQKFSDAVKDRKDLANDIFAVLRQVTGAPNLTTTTAGTPEYDALRWLAQLAVNIVDYIDKDEIMTTFAWNPSNPSEFVIGTELPRVVINEVFAEIVNDPSDVTNPMIPPTPSSDYKVLVWAELLNPFSGEDSTNYVEPISGIAGGAPLQTSGATPYGIYKFVIANPTPATAMRTCSNTLGTPTATNILSEVTSYTPDALIQPGLLASQYQFIKPVNANFKGTPVGVGSGGNDGFYVLGPRALGATLVGDPANDLPATLRVQQTMPAGTPPPKVNGMVYGVSVNTPIPAVAGSTGVTNDFFLQRLACPYLPNNETAPGTPASPYNPYITVDYVSGIPVQDGLTKVKTYTGGLPGGLRLPAVNAKTSRYSYGKMQPYASGAFVPAPAVPTNSQIRQATAPGVTALGPVNTFYQHNSSTGAFPIASNTNQTVPFDWLVHLDRELISPMELLYVSAFKPHELTQQFIIRDPAPSAPADTFLKFQHFAPWFDQSSLLYRALDFLSVHDRMNSVSLNLRVPGKININTIWDFETFMALCDPQASNTFTSGDLLHPNAWTNPSTQFDPTTSVTPPTSRDTVWRQFINARTPWLRDAVQYTNTPVPGAGNANVRFVMNGTTVEASQNLATPPVMDRPFMGFATGFTNPPAVNTQYSQYPYGIGIENTILRNFTPPAVGSSPSASDPRLFSAPTTPPDGRTPAATDPWNHPYGKNQLLTKIANNVTTRSNVFAVWLTVGFFEVVQEKDENNNPIYPVKLGAEINADRSQNIRHRMFAIVDRTNLSLFDRDAAGSLLPLTTSSTISSMATPAPGAVPPNGSGANPTPTAPLSYTVQVNSLTGTTSTTANSIPWSIQVGSLLVIDKGASQETVKVTATTASPPTFTATFQLPHNAGFGITMPGNPGPQPNFDAKKDDYLPVVPYTIVLQ